MRSGGFLLLKPADMAWLKSLSAVTVLCCPLKPCWNSGTGKCSCQSFQDFDRGAEQRDGAERCGFFRRLVWFEKGDHDGGLPDGRDGAGGDGEVEDLCQVLDAMWA